MFSYQKALNFLSELEIFGIKLGLDQVSELFQRIGNPHEKLRFIHVAGTNGKGSTCAMLAKTLESAGFRVGFYSSPHLVSVRERFRINGKSISRKKFSKLLSKLAPHVKKMRKDGKCPTHFEVTTALAAMFFAEENADFVVWETGMGGRFDATNIVMPVVSVITGIGIDHASRLGETEAEIAFEKAGIIKPRIPVFCGRLSAEAKKIIMKKVEKVHAKCIFPSAKYKIVERPALPEKTSARQIIEIDGTPLSLPLLGDIQAENAALVYKILKYLSAEFKFNLCQAISGFGKTRWHARFQILPDGSILDGAHNPQAVGILLSSAKQYFPREKYSIIFGCFADKDASNMLKMLAKFAEEFLFVPIHGSRKSLTPDELETICRKVAGKPVFKLNSVKAALKRPHKKRFLITGSLYLAGEVLREYFTEDEIANI